MEKTLEKLLEIITNIGMKLLWALLIIFIGFKLIKVLTKIIKNGKAFQKLEKSVQTFILSFLSITLKIILFASAAGIMGVPMTSIITLLGSAGLAIGLALQGGLSNLAGGLMILMFRPFKVGHYIEIENNGGTVSDISIFYTTLTTPDNKRIIIPNGIVASETITNYSLEKYRRVDLKFQVGYESDIEKVKKVIATTIEKEEQIIKTKPVFIRLTEQQESALVFTVRVWTKQEDYWTVYLNLQENMKKALDKNKIEIPYNKLDVIVKKAK